MSDLMKEKKTEANNEIKTGISDSAAKTGRIKRVSGKCNDEEPGYYQQVSDILETCAGVNVSFNRDSTLKFPVYLTESMEATPIECLDLSQRSSNCLRRAGINNIGVFCERISRAKDLDSIRNCGQKSKMEIMEKLFVYQYKLLSPERQKTFIKKVIELNRM